MKYIEQIKPTTWNTWKTEAIDFSQDFRWLDDDIYSPELNALADHNCKDKLIKVDLHKNSKQSWEIIKSFDMKTELIAIKQDIIIMEVDATDCVGLIQQFVKK